MLIIYPPTVHWDFMTARPQHLMREFVSQGDKVIFCEPGNHLEPKLRKIREGLWLNYGTPIDQWPVSESEKRVLWVSYPGNVSMIGKFKEDIVVYDVLDYPEEEFMGWKPYVKELLTKSSIVFTVSRPLYDYFSLLHSNVHLVRNGVDFDFFSSVKDEYPKELRSISKPIVGFYGALAPWVDWELVAKLAHHNPSISFVFIGPTIGMDMGNLPKGRNLFFLGRKPYQELPQYAHFFDVCILPFKKTPMTVGVNPVKVYEYLAMGKPVVATDIPEILEMDPHVYGAADISGFQDNLLKAIGHDKIGLSEARKKFAMANTWKKRAIEIRNIITRVLL